MQKFTQADMEYHDRRAEQETRLADGSGINGCVHETLARFHSTRALLIAAALAAAKRNPTGVCVADKEA